MVGQHGPDIGLTPGQMGGALFGLTEQKINPIKARLINDKRLKYTFSLFIWLIVDLYFSDN